MLGEWIRNAPLDLVRRIAEDVTIRNYTISRLASEELARRRTRAA